MKFNKETSNLRNQMISKINLYFKNIKKSILWMETDNWLLGGLSPDYMIKIGRGEKLKKFIEIAFEEAKNARDAKKTWVSSNGEGGGDWA